MLTHYLKINSNLTIQDNLPRCGVYHTTTELQTTTELDLTADQVMNKC